MKCLASLNSRDLTKSTLVAPLRLFFATMALLLQTTSIRPFVSGQLVCHDDARCRHWVSLAASSGSSAYSAKYVDNLN